MSDLGLQMVGQLLAACEAASLWPAQVSCLGMPMLEKGTGGFRLIGVFPGLIRLWGRARSGGAAMWEQQRLDADHFAAKKGSAAEDVAWRIGINMEQAALAALGC